MHRGLQKWQTRGKTYHYGDGLHFHGAPEKYVKEHQLGRVKVNYRLRDAIFSRQRYWGEPFPVYYKDGMPYMIDESKLPLELPEVDKFLPTETGEPPLGHATKWHGMWLKVKS